VPEPAESSAVAPAAAQPRGTVRGLAGALLVVAGFLVFLGTYWTWLTLTPDGYDPIAFNGVSWPDVLALGEGVEVRAGYLLAPLGFLISLMGLLIVLGGKPWLSWVSLGASAVVAFVGWERFLMVRQEVSALPLLLELSEVPATGIGLFVVVGSSTLALAGSIVLVIAALARAPRSWEGGAVLIVLAGALAVWFVQSRPPIRHWYTTDSVSSLTGLSAQQRQDGRTFVVVEVTLPPALAEQRLGKQHADQFALERPDGTGVRPVQLSSITTLEGEKTKDYLQIVFVARRTDAHLARLRLLSDHHMPITLSSRYRRPSR
jgi:hypothetical protein